ncbi:MAG TPA: M14 family metallopeptidase [bacterium]|nr:M14 family metallopeptidase [bacterium]
MTPPSLLHMSAPLREDFDIPFHRIGKQEGPPEVALVGGLHGEELNTVFVLGRLADYLHRVEAGKYPGLTLKGSFLIVPAINVLGLNTRSRHWPFDKTDINRMFPGYDQGETTQRIAAAVLKATEPAKLRIELRCSNQDLEEMPHLRIYESDAEERRIAQDFGLGTILEKRIGKLSSVSLIQAWKNSGGMNFVLRAGRGGGLQLAYCERLFAALRGFLHHRGFLVDPHCPEPDENILPYKPGSAFRILSEQAGFFVSHLNPGQWLQAGDLVGILYDGYTGKVRGEVHAPVGGLVLGLRRQPLTFEGDMIAKILRP